MPPLGTYFVSHQRLGTRQANKTIEGPPGFAPAFTMSDDEVEEPPERRAPSGRANRGSRMAKLMAEGEEEQEDQADKEFYDQGFWADAEGDAEYADADDEQAADSFDSDFGESTESDEDEEDAEKAVRTEQRQQIARKKGAYVDPKAKRGAPAVARPKSSKKRSSSVAFSQSIQRGSLRASTQVRTHSKEHPAQTRHPRKVAATLAGCTQGPSRLS